MMKSCICGRNIVGCNIVEPSVDDTAAYTREILIQRVKDYSAYGFSHLEFSHLLTITTEDGAAIRETCRKAGIVPWSVHSEQLNDSDVEGYFRTQTHCAQVADALDARVMVVHLPNLTPRFDLQPALDIVGRLVDLAAKYGLRLAVENCLKGDIDFIIRLIDEIQSPNLGFNLDTGHALCHQQADIPQVVRLIGKRLITTHLHDNFGQHDDHQMPGLGLIDWRGTIAALLEIGYDGPLMMEMTANCIKAERTAEELHTYDLEKELIQGRAYLTTLWEQERNK